jgi:signal transduction histidine kinase
MEDKVDHISELEGLNSELEGFLSGLQAREEDLSSRIGELEGELASAKEAYNSELQRLSAREDALSAALETARKALSEENARSVSAVSERDDLARRLEAAAKALQEEKARSAELDLYVNSSRSVLKEKESDAEKIWRTMEELKAELALERASLKDREAQIQKYVKIKEGLEKRLEQASQEASRSEEGFALKVELLKNELRELTRKNEELDRRLSAAAPRIDEAMAEAAHKDKLYAEAKALVAEKDEALKGANQRVRELLRDIETARSGDGRATAERAKELASSLAARVEELEEELNAAAERSLEKLRASQNALSAAQAALRAKDEDLAQLRARENTLQRELGDAEEKWKLASAQLHNAFSKLRTAENENEISAGRIKSLEEERNKFRAAAIKAEASAAAIVAQESQARDSEAAGLKAALEEQAAKYTALLRRYDELVLSNEAITLEKNSALAECEALRHSIENIESGAAGAAGAEKARYEELSRKLREAQALAKKKDFDAEAVGRIAAAAQQDVVDLRARLAAAEAASAETATADKGRYGELSGRLQAAEAALKRKDFELQAAVSVQKTLQADLDEAIRRVEGAEAALAGSGAVEKARYAELSARLRDAQAQLKKRELDLDAAVEARASLEGEAEALRSRLAEVEQQAADAAGAERARYAELSEKMHTAGALLKQKEFELDEARSALSDLESECSLLRRSRTELGEKYAREIQAENELLKEAQAKVLERDSTISRLSLKEEELKGEAEALRREKQELASLMRRKAAPAQSARASEAERLLAEKEARLEKLRSELEDTRAEKAELQGREKELREELKARPYRAMLREAEEKLVIKEKMLSEVNQRMKRIGRDFEELKERGQASGAPGYLPDFEELVAGVAHQIANSISIIRSHAEFCSEAPESEGAKESLDVIVRNIVALQKKIDTIMNFSRPVIPQRSPERLSAAVSEALAAMRASGRLKGIKVKHKGGEKLKAVSLDRVRFASALEQLLQNAAEAMPAGGEITVSFSSADGRQRLEIADTGEGVEKKNMSTIFHPFFTTRPGKMGLGLTLARNIVRAHGGTLELKSEHGKGATAVIELPEA